MIRGQNMFEENLPLTTGFGIPYQRKSLFWLSPFINKMSKCLDLDIDTKLLMTVDNDPFTGRRLGGKFYKSKELMQLLRNKREGVIKQK